VSSPGHGSDAFEEMVLCLIELQAEEILDLE